MFSNEFYDIFKTTFFAELLWVAFGNTKATSMNVIQVSYRDFGQVFCHWEMCGISFP